MSDPLIGSGTIVAGSALFGSAVSAARSPRRRRFAWADNLDVALLPNEPRAITTRRAHATPCPPSMGKRRVAVDCGRELELHRMCPPMHRVALPCILQLVVAVVAIDDGDRKASRGEHVAVLDRH